MIHMGFSINLRGDLAKLSDAELATRLDEAWQTYTALQAKFPRRKLSYSERGLIRHPLAYRFLSVLGVSGPGYGYFGTAPNVIGPKYWHPHLILCDIRDLTDEAQHRIDKRQGTKG